MGGPYINWTYGGKRTAKGMANSWPKWSPVPKNKIRSAPIPKNVKGWIRNWHRMSKIKQNHVKSPVTCSFALLFPIFYASPASAPSASNTSVAWNGEGDLQSFNRTVCNPFKTRYIVQPCTAPIVMHRLIIFGNAICVEMRVNLPVCLSKMGLVHFTLVPCFWPEFKNNIGCEPRSILRGCERL